MRCKECGDSFQSEYETQKICGDCSSPQEFAAPFPGDLQELLKFAFCAGAGFDHPSKFDEATKKRWEEYGKRPVPLSTHQRVHNATETEFEQLRAIKTAAQAYVDSVNGDPEKDCWDTPDGKEAPGAERFASDWSWREYDAKKQKAFEALQEVLA